MKETEYALARRMSSESSDPDIIPVIIEGPPPPSPPEALKDIHFNDSLLYVLAGAGGGRPFPATRQVCPQVSSTIRYVLLDRF
jgi:hypothetical protein